MGMASARAHAESKVGGKRRKGKDRGDGEAEAGEVAGVVSSVRVYPVKSCSGMEVEAWPVGPTGLVLDRALCVVNAASGEFCHARKAPQMLTCRATATIHDLGPHPDAPLLPSKFDIRLTVEHVDSQLTITARDVRAGDGDEPREVSVWSSHMLAAPVEARKARVSTWVSDLLRWSPWARPTRGRSVPAMSTSLAAPVTARKRRSPTRSRLARDGLETVSMERFRPNVVVTTTTPHIEDRWRRIRIGEFEFGIASACSRCILTTIDPSTGAFTDVPFKTLQSYRRPPKGARPLFGVKLVQLAGPATGGELAVGLDVEVLELADEPIMRT
ncbi:MOSC domain-containing protein [Thecamonas trahens ATCC 50062]|uniref:MOSC domain-containing protein n=1 Tax=Thecamonas trahens ATCC 50062 TaxID=461836 RepID=A0A0L0D9X8_THETB|nr:MOSC domain-containing protein [Thecamonas trahens ATCC 50062]KNC49144.1 MOSC domain-containing protein [Thecamonas trahens ATCC 50062]|eukprot:XP_013758169.1 MOSC domain-containing protein [Thecamonas trahens ATCC 50062]